MPWTAAAVVGGAVIGGAATNSAADKAADATADAASQSNATTRYMYDTTRQDQAPYRTTGVSALNQLASMYGLDQYEDPATQTTYMPGGDLFRMQNRTPRVNELLYQEDPIYRQAWDEASAEFGFKDSKVGSYKTDKGKLEAVLRQKMEANPAYRRRIAGQTQGTTYDNETGQPVRDWSSFFDSPDYQFALEQGNRSVNQGLAARGMSNSGAAMKELTRYGQGMASQQLGNYTNRLASLAGIGQTATQATGNAGMTAAGNMGAATMAAGDARASAYQQRGSAINNVINQGVGAFQLAQMQPNWGGTAQPSIYGNTGTSTLPQGQVYA